MESRDGPPVGIQAGACAWRRGGPSSNVTVSRHSTDRMLDPLSRSPVQDPRRYRFGLVSLTAMPPPRPPPAYRSPPTAPGHGH